MSDTATFAPGALGSIDLPLWVRWRHRQHDGFRHLRGRPVYIQIFLNRKEWRDG